MKKYIIPSVLLSLFISAVPTAADTLTLKDGKVLEGRVLSKTSDVYVFEYKANKSGTIKDVMRVPRNQIAKLVEVRPDEVAFAKLTGLVPTPDLLTSEDYAQRIKRVRDFLTKYPETLEKKAALGIIDKLAVEAKAVAAGGFKLDGKMITGDEWRANAYDLDARALEQKIRDAQKAGKTLEMLRAFDQLEAEFPTSASFRTMAPIIAGVMKVLNGKIVACLAGFDAQTEKRESDLASMGGTDRDNVARAIEQKMAMLEARYQAEKAAEQRWVTPSPDHRQSLEDSASVLDSELSRLGEPITAPPVDPGKAYRDAWRVIRVGSELEDVEKAYEVAQSAALPEKYLKLLQESAKACGFALGSDS